MMSKILPIIFFLSVFNCEATIKDLTENKVEVVSRDEEQNKSIMMVYHYLKENKLTSLDDRCLSYDFDDGSPRYFSVSVRETNRHGVCASDPNVSAVLFNFRINKKSWLISTDAYSTDGSFIFVK